MSEKTRFIHFNTDAVRDQTEILNGDIAFLKESRVIETHGIKYGLLQWNEIEESSIPTEGLIARYSARGKTNQDSDRDVLKDLSGNGHDIHLYNFGWSGMSGYGGYTFNFSDLIITYPEYVTERNDHSVRINRIVDGKALLVSNDASGIPTLKSKVKISGLPTDEGYIVFRYYNSDNIGGDNNTVNLTNGIHDVDLSPSSETQNAFYIYIPVQSDQGITEDTDLDIRIELIPLYPNALVSDGIDDYGICNNFPVLTKENGYTIIARRKWINYTAPSCFITNGNGATGSFLFERIELSGNKRTYNLGIGTDVNEYPELITYQTSKEYNGVELSTGTPTETANALKLFNLAYDYTPIALYDIFIYDHDLTSDEISKVTSYLQSLAYEDEMQTGSIDYIDIWDTYGKSILMRIEIS